MDAIDGFRASVAGEAMSCIVAIIYIMGDWQEYAVTMGLPTWSSLTDLCLLCTTDK